MALLLDMNNIDYGYFYSDNWDIVCEYIYYLLSIKNESMIIKCHASSKFQKDNEIREMHMRPQPSLILDPQQPEDLIQHLLENHLGLMEDLDNFEDFESSGWNIIPKTYKYWIKVYPCQPNPSAKPTVQNSDNLNDNDDNEPPSKKIKKTCELNKLIGCISMFFYPGQLRRENLLKERQLEKFINETPNCRFLKPFMYMPNFKLSGLANWHQNKLKLLNIRVFSLKGNVLYAKAMEPQFDDYINLYINSNDEFAYIKKLNAFFGKSLNRTLCSDCNTWHRNEGVCKISVIESGSEDIELPSLPHGRHGLVCYADFESIIKNNYHNTSGFCIVAINKKQEKIFDITKSIKINDDIINEFFIDLFKIADNYVISNKKSDNLCKLCGEIIEKENFIYGKNFINSLEGNHHIDCWNDRKNAMYIFMHNFRGYDSHFLMQEICKKYNVLHMQANSMEKFNLILLNRFDKPEIKICFKDTFNFFSTSLANCVKMVEKWQYTPENYRNSKGVFPYDWFDNFDKLNFKGLPPKPWINKMTGQEINSEIAQEVWIKEKFKIFEEYHNFYCHLDTIQLCDVFEEFRLTCLSEFNIDPVHFMGAPALTWYLGLKNNIEMFKIIPNAKIYLDIQNHIRGGVSQAMVRYCEPKENESILFLDVNSLYSKCMTYKMPGKFLRYLENLPNNWEKLYNENSNITLFVNCDLEYPQHLHDRDWPYPLAPHKFNGRLCTTFLPKENYMIHIELLKFYLDRGLILIKVNYCYEFEQDFTLRDYVDNNIIKRRETKSEVMKTLYKLLNNSLYGKTCENVFKYRKFDVITQNELNSGQINPQLYKTRNMISYDDTFLCEADPDKVKLDKPIQIGFTVLEFAKREIYKFIAAIQDKFGDKVIPLYTDTDSIMFHCKMPNAPYEFYQNLKEFLDFEKIPKEWGDIKTKGTNKISGLWSPESDGKKIKRYVGLRAKCYCYEFDDGNIVIKNKGVPRSALISENDDEIKREITINDYISSLFDNKEHKVCYYNIRSNKHEVTTKHLYKLGISANDFKRTVLADRTYSLPFGYLGELFKTNDSDDPDFLEQWHLPQQ